GEAPTTQTGDELVDAYLWIKRPGESDGDCKGGPKAGDWWPEYALGLAGATK
ncbi:endoglucanase, partial [Streptomyces sp. SID4931]